MGAYNYICVALGALAAFSFAYCANKILKANKQKYYGTSDFYIFYGPFGWRRNGDLA